MNTKQCAEFWQFSTSWVYRHRFQLGGYRVGRMLRFDEADQVELRERLKGARKRLTFPPVIIIDNAKGGRRLAKKKPACFNYGCVYQRTYRSGRASWTIGYYDENGKRVQRALPEAQTREEAVLALQRRVKETFDKKFGVERKNIGFRTFARSFLEDCMMTTRRNIRPDALRLDRLCGYFGDTDLRAVTPMRIERFRKERLRAGNAKSTTNRYLALMKTMYSVAIQEGFAESNPVKKVKFFPERGRERILTEAEEVKLMEECSDALRSIVTVALNTGMRKGEILALQWSEVDFKARIIRVEKTKSGKHRDVPVNDAVFNELRALYSVGNIAFVFTNPQTQEPYTDIKKGFKSACRRAGIEGLRFHDLRHTFATRLLEKGVDIKTVCELCGHSSVTVTEKYCHSDDSRKSKAVELLTREAEDKVCDAAVTQESESKLIH